LNFSCQSSKEPDLPIIMIDTFSQDIPDEPKISAQMAITYNGSENVTKYSDSSYYYKGYIGIETRGHTSQRFPKKQYGLETRNADGDNLSVSLFGMPEEKDWILYAPFSDKSLMRNVVAYDIYRSMGYYAPRTKFCQLLINGDYVGVYVFMEKIKKDIGRVEISSPTTENFSGGYLLELDGFTRVDSTDIYILTEKKKQVYTIKFPKKKDITGDPMYKRSRKGIGYLSQEPSIFGKLSVEDNLRLVLELTDMSKSDQEEKINKLLEDLSISHLRKNKGGSLSGGERRRVEICRSLAIDPDFILLDEPFAGVDPIAVEDIQSIVHSLKNRDIGVLITDHNVRETLSITDRSYLLFEGEILKSGTSDELANDPEARRLYLGEKFSLN